MQDHAVSPHESMDRVAAVNAAGGHAKLTRYPHANHDAWTAAYGDDELWAWMFDQGKESTDEE